MTLRYTLPAAYARHGYEVREGAGSGNLTQCMALWRDGRRLDTGFGISWADIAIFERLAETFTPQSIFGIGNGFGWSTVAMRLIWSEAKLVVMDAGIEGADNLAAIKLTNMILSHLDCGDVCWGSSPESVKLVIDHTYIDPINLVFIDGDHTNEQQTADFAAILPYLAKDHIVLFHDVTICGMQLSFDAIATDYPGRAKILNTPTGMGAVWTGGIGARL